MNDWRLKLEASSRSATGGRLGTPSNGPIPLQSSFEALRIRKRGILAKFLQGTTEITSLMKDRFIEENFCCGLGVLPRKSPLTSCAAVGMQGKDHVKIPNGEHGAELSHKDCSTFLSFYKA